MVSDVAPLVGPVVGATVRDRRTLQLKFESSSASGRGGRALSVHVRHRDVYRARTLRGGEAVNGRCIRHGAIHAGKGAERDRSTGCEVRPRDHYRGPAGIRSILGGHTGSAGGDRRSRTRLVAATPNTAACNAQLPLTASVAAVLPPEAAIMSPAIFPSGVKNAAGEVGAGTEGAACGASGHDHTVRGVGNGSTATGCCRCPRLPKQFRAGTSRTGRCTLKFAYRGQIHYC